MSRTRGLVGWCVAGTLVVGVLGASVHATRLPDEAPAMDRVLPLDRGTTWVYAVADHGEPSGHHVRRVVGPAQVITDDGLTQMTRMLNHYDDYQDQVQTYGLYVSTKGDSLVQHALIARGEKLDVVPPAQGLKLPAEVGTAWSYEGERGGNPLSFRAEVTDTGDVEVGDHTFEDCAEYTTTIDLRDDEGNIEEGDVEVVEEWTCPGVGVVRSRDVVESQDVEITEELVSFQGRHLSLVLGDVRGVPRCADDCGLPSAHGFDQHRGFALPDGELGRALAWSETRDEFTPHPAVSDGSTVVHGDRDGVVSARDVAGGLRWQVTLSPPIVVTPVVADGLVLVADATKALWALSLDDGSTQWVSRFDDVVGATPVVGDRVVAVATETGAVTGLDLEDGTELWQVEVGGLVRTPPALDDDVLIVGDQSGTLTALDIDDGTEQWTTTLAVGLDNGPTLAGDLVLAVDGRGVLVAHELEDGDAVWQSPSTSYPTQPLAATDDVVVALMESDEVEARAVDDGELLWSTAVEETDTSPVVVGDEVLVAETDGHVTVLGLEDGDLRDGWDLPRPTADATLEVETPLAVVGGDLVVTAEVFAPDIGYTSYAYPVTGDPRPRGIAYTVEPFVFPLPLGAAPVLDGDQVYGLGFEQSLFRSDGAESAPLLSETGPTVGLAADDGIVVVPNGEEVWGVDGASGDPLWKLPTGAAFFGTYPAVADGTAYVPVREVGLTAVDAATGDIRWVQEVSGTAGTSVPVPLPGGDVVYAASGLTRYDGRTGEPVWALDGLLEDAVAYAPISVADGHAYAQLSYFDAESPTFESTDVVAADLESGELLWGYRVPVGAFGVGTAAGDGVVVSIDGDRQVVGLDGATGELLWTYQLGSVAAGTPVVVDGVVHLAERGRPEDLLQRDFRIVSLDVRTGGFVGSYEPPSGNDVPLGTVGAGPDGELLVPTTSEIGQNVAVVGVTRD